MFRYLFVFALTATAALASRTFKTYSCNTCTYGVQNGAMVWECFSYKKGAGRRTCPPDFHCYSAHISYDKTAKDPELDNRDPGLGHYEWVFEGCIYKTQDPVRYICSRKIRTYRKLVGTSNHECMVDTCEGNLCNESITQGYIGHGY